MTDISEDSSSDMSSPYQSDEGDIIKSTSYSRTDHYKEYSSNPSGSPSDWTKYRNYTELQLFRISDTSGSSVFPRQMDKKLSECSTSVLSRLKERYDRSFIYISKTLMTDLQISQRMDVPASVMCDAFVVSPFRPVGIFTFLIDDAVTDYDTCLAYTSRIAKAVTSSVRDVICNFSLVHGVFYHATYDDTSEFVDNIKQLEERAYQIGRKSRMDLDEIACDPVIQTFVNLLFDFKDISCATVAMETACRDGNLQLVKDIISVSPETVNIQSEHGDTPLIWASLGGHYDVVTVLLSHKADVNVKNNRGETSLLMACRKSLLHKTLDRGKETDITWLGCILAGDLHVSVDKTSDDNKIYTNIVELLLSHGADENVVDDDGFTTLLLTCIFGDLEVTELLLSRGVNVNYTGIFGSTALMWACVFCHGSIVDRLIQAGANVNIMANLNISALFISSYFGHEKIVEKLISHGANVDEADDDEHTPLWFAALYGFLNVVNLLLSHRAQIDKPDCNGSAPLMAASMSGQSGVVETLISQGGDVNHQNTWDWTPLLLSAMYGHTDTARLLLSHGAKIDTRDVDDMTALMWTCVGGWDDVVELLLSNGADVNITDEDGHTPLTLVCSNVQNVYEWLYLDDDDDDDDNKVLSFFVCNISKPQSLEYHMNQLKAVSNDRTQSFMLGFAHLTGDTDLLSSLQRVFSYQHTDSPSVKTDDGDTRRERILKMLLSHGADVNSTKEDGNSALLVACAEGYESGVRVLLQHGADFNIHNENGDTALTIAHRQGHADIIEHLLDHKADVNAKGSEETIPLTEASREGHDAVVEKQLRHGADVNAKGSDGDTPLTEASREGHDTVVEKLLRHGADVTISNNDGETALTVAKKVGHATVVDILLKHQAGTNTGETVSSLSQDPRTDLSSQQSDDVDTVEEGEKVLERNTNYNANTDVNVTTSNKTEKKGTGLRLKSKKADKAREIFSRTLCKVS